MNPYIRPALHESLADVSKPINESGLSLELVTKPRGRRTTWTALLNILPSAFTVMHQLRKRSTLDLELNILMTYLEEGIYLTELFVLQNVCYVLYIKCKILS